MWNRASEEWFCFTAYPVGKKSRKYGLKWKDIRAVTLKSMVAVRRLKRLLQFSIFAVLIASLLLLLQSNEISNKEKLNVKKRGKAIYASLTLLRVFDTIECWSYPLVVRVHWSISSVAITLFMRILLKGEVSFDAEDEENFRNFFDRESDLNVKEISKVNSVLMCMAQSTFRFTTSCAQLPDKFRC